LKVLFDTQIFDWQINGGISRYFIEVVNRLDQRSDIDILFKCRHSYNTYIQGSKWLTQKPVLKNLHFKGKLSALKILNQRINRSFSNEQLKTGGADIFHPTYYDPYFLNYLHKTPLVLTVYDLTNEKYNDQSVLTQKVLAWKKQLIHAASHIIAISENTRKDVIEYYKVSPEKVTTVYLAGGFDEAVRNAPQDDNKSNLPERFILFVGSRVGYKNFNSFIAEVAPVLRGKNISLIAAGGGMMNATELALLKELGITDRVIAFPHVEDTFLAHLYKKAAAFVFPSLYEGFGLPVLESMQCSCPALLSDNSSLPEVGGEAAVYFNPLEKGSLQNKLNEVLENERLRMRMREKGLKQVEMFNWTNTANGHMEVYKKLIP
jgi:glycosyltransferase involved in cell wall biosynthesis